MFQIVLKLSKIENLIDIVSVAYRIDSKGLLVVCSGTLAIPCQIMLQCHGVCQWIGVLEL